MSDPDAGDPASDPWPDVLEWLHVAESDQRVVRLCLTADPPLRDAATFHCQQAAEKLLKGFLVQAGVHVRKTHDLDALAELVLHRFPTLDALLTPLRSWTSWSVAYRYPGEAGLEPEPSVEELSQALDVIAQLDAALRSLAPPAPDAGNP
ncbi:MAG: HEPN domain-containing protein [Rhodopila sp.]|nr:HEPN domain-containing protein [Rhodopila sp.]